MNSVSGEAAGVAATPPRVVLFDFDGVLIHGDAFHLFMRERYARSLWRPVLALLCAPLLLRVRALPAGQPPVATRGLVVSAVCQ